MEWEETIDLSMYAIRLRLSYLHRLPELLEAYEEKGRLREAQKVGAGCWEAADGMDGWLYGRQANERAAAASCCFLLLCCCCCCDAHAAAAQVSVCHGTRSGRLLPEAL